MVFSYNLMLISQRNIEYKKQLNILYSIRMPPTTLAVDCLNDPHQSCASRIHMSPLLLWKEVRPSTDPVGSLVDNLQEGRIASIVKDSIVMAVPLCPDQSANPNSDSRFGYFINPVQPVTKHVLNIHRGRHVECKLDHSPD
jgi:hypothetical protein